MSNIAQTSTGRVLTLSLDRPEKMNALTRDMYADLARALNEAAGDFTVRAVILTSTGAHFTAGNDIKDFMENPPTTQDSTVAAFLGALLDFPKPLLAAVKGNAVGVGTTMLLHCDVVVAEGMFLRDPNLECYFDKQYFNNLKLFYLNFLQFIIFNKNRLKSNCKVFFPSTIFLDDKFKAKQFSEYTKAKKEVENVSEKFNKVYRKLFYNYRLKAFDTDQNYSLYKKKIKNDVYSYVNILKDFIK